MGFRIAMPTPGISSTGNVLGSGIYAAAGSYGYWNVDLDFDTSPGGSQQTPTFDPTPSAPTPTPPKPLPPAETLDPQQLEALQALFSVITVVEIALLYEAAFDRKPDVTGLNYWYSQAVEGLATSDIARSFLASPEFAFNFGAPNSMSNAQFVDTLYFNVLNRAPEAGGKAFWLGELNKGAARADVLGNLSTSDENVSQATYLVGLDITDNGWII
ncbi:MAG: DUF4214 domain-containing protein [Beijerinckiaceae bacterium]